MKTGSDRGRSPTTSGVNRRSIPRALSRQHSGGRHSFLSAAEHLARSAPSPRSSSTVRLCSFDLQHRLVRVGWVRQQAFLTAIDIKVGFFENGLSNDDLIAEHQGFFNRMAPQ